MGGHILVTLLVTRVLRHKVHVVTTNNDCLLHLVSLHDSFHDTATNRDAAGKRAGLVHVSSFLGLGRGFKAQADVLKIADRALALGAAETNEGLLLLLVGTFILETNTANFKTKP